MKAKRPLSPALYFWRNKFKAMPVLGIILLSVLGVLLVGVLADSMLDNIRRNWVGPFHYYASVYARKGALPENLGARLRQNPDVDRILSAVNTQLRVTDLKGSSRRSVVGLAAGEMDFFLQATGMQLVEGRLPDGSRREIVLNTMIMRNKQLRIGDTVGQEIDRLEYLPGSFTVVGTIEGPFDIGITTAGALREVLGLSGESALYLFPRPGRKEALDREVQQLDSNQVAAETLPTMTTMYEDETANIGAILWSINGVMILVLSLAVGLLSNIYFMERIGEFGMLSAIGYSNAYLIRRAITESTVLTVSAWVLGLLLTIGLSGVIRDLLFVPKGMVLVNVGPSNVLSTLPILILTVVASLVTVIRRLRKLDPVSIIERRD